MRALRPGTAAVVKRCGPAVYGRQSGLLEPVGICTEKQSDEEESKSLHEAQTNERTAHDQLPRPYDPKPYDPKPAHASEARSQRSRGLRCIPSNYTRICNQLLDVYM